MRWDKQTRLALAPICLQVLLKQVLGKYCQVLKVAVEKGEREPSFEVDRH